MQVRTLLFLTLFITLCGGTASAQRVRLKYVAVIETQVDAQSGAARELNKDEVREVTGVIRNAAARNLPRDKYSIITAETVQSMGDAVLEECAEENCIITLASKINADYIVRGVIRKFRESFSLSVEMYEAEHGALVTSAVVRTTNLNEKFLNDISAACAEMYKDFSGQTPPTPIVTPTPQPPAVAPKHPIVTTRVFTDSRDGKKYKAVVMPDGKTWMAENLNYTPSSGKSWCYKNKSSNCDAYGRLYDWNTAMEACPADWRLPSNAEWSALEVAVGGSSTAGKALKSAAGWKKHKKNGTDDFGFSALPGGYRWSDGYFYRAGYYGLWWTATEGDGSNAGYRNMYYNNENVGQYWDFKDLGFSLRCLRD